MKDCKEAIELKPGKIYDIDFSGYNSFTQDVLAELILAWLWRYAKLCGKEMENGIFIVCDEF